MFISARMYMNNFNKIYIQNLRSREMQYRSLFSFMRISALPGFSPSSVFNCCYIHFLALKRFPYNQSRQNPTKFHQISHESIIFFLLFPLLRTSGAVPFPLRFRGKTDAAEMKPFDWTLRIVATDHFTE